MRNQASYPSNWREISKRIIKSALNRCEKCGLENGVVVRVKGRRRELVPEERYIALKKELERRKTEERQATTLKAAARALNRNFLGDVDDEAGYYAEGDFYEFDNFDELELEYPAAAELRAMAFIGDDEVECLDWYVRVVFDRDGLLVQSIGHLEARSFVHFGCEVLFALKHRIESLNRRDAHSAHGIELVGPEMLDVVKLGELAAVIGRDELLEFFVSLASKVPAIDEEEHPLRLSELHQSIDLIDGRESLAAPRSHLDQCAREVESQRVFQVLNCRDLCRP